MSTPFCTRRYIRPATADRLYSVYRLARRYGYDDSAAQAAAVYALGRYNQGGYQDFAIVVERIHRHATRAPGCHPEDYAALIAGHTPRLIPLRLRGNPRFKWSLVCACDDGKQP